MPHLGLFTRSNTTGEITRKTMGKKLPKMMKAVVLKKIVGRYSEGRDAVAECLEVKEVPRPVPKFNEVLVKVQRAQVRLA